MKHFEIDLSLGNHTFTHYCTTVYEGIQAIADIYTSLGQPCFHADAYIETLMNMKNGTTLSHRHNNIAIRYVEGEV